MRVALLMGTAVALSVTLAACGQKTSAVANQNPQPSYARPADVQGDSAPAAVPDSTIAQVGGKPMWAANRRHTAEENAQYQFTKNGGDFGAKTETDYVAMAHAFVDRPPSDAETIDRRNGDKLIYDPKANVFAVVSRDGAPRTMFKPRDGASYWTEQKERESQRANGQAPGAGGDQS